MRTRNFGTEEWPSLHAEYRYALEQVEVARSAFNEVTGQHQVSIAVARLAAAETHLSLILDEILRLQYTLPSLSLISTITVPTITGLTIAEPTITGPTRNIWQHFVTWFGRKVGID